MGIFDIPAATGPTAEDAARQTRQILLRLVNQSDQGLSRIRDLVNTHTRAAIATELGGDAAALATVYTALKDMLEDVAIGRTVDALPT